MSCCMLKQNIGGTSCGFINIQSNRYMSTSNWKCSPVHISVKSVKMNILHVNIKRWSLYFSQGGRMAYPKCHLAMVSHENTPWCHYIQLKEQPYLALCQYGNPGSNTVKLCCRISTISCICFTHSRSIGFFINGLVVNYGISNTIVLEIP